MNPVEGLTAPCIENIKGKTYADGHADLNTASPLGAQLMGMGYDIVWEGMLWTQEGYDFERAYVKK